VTNEDRVLSFLGSIAPADATNAEIVSRTGIKPHQQVFMITRDLMRRALIKGVQSGKEWRFSVRGSRQRVRVSPALAQTRPPESKTVPMSPAEFEKVTQRVMGEWFGTSLAPGRVAAVPKIFDLVSGDHRIVGDAKYFTMVQGKRLPPAKFSVIAEHVWLLESTDADRKFLVFGNDRRVPEEWLQRYGPLVHSVEFYFLDGETKLHRLNETTGKSRRT